jgi:hypothetical protein
MRIPLAVALETRDGSSAKDQRLFNGIGEVSGDQLGVIKRPGSVTTGTISAGASQLLGEFSGRATAATGDSLVQLVVSPFGVYSTDALSPITAGLSLTYANKAQGDNTNAVLIKSSQEAWVLT